MTDFEKVVDFNNMYRAFRKAKCGKGYKKSSARFDLAALDGVHKHIVDTVKEDGSRDIKVNPEPYIRFLLENPNPFTTGQKFREQLATSLKINNHAFALIVRDENGLPTAMYHLNATMATTEYDSAGRLSIRFYFLNGKSFVFCYSDLIHLRGDVGIGHEFFGGSKVSVYEIH